MQATFNFSFGDRYLGSGRGRKRRQPPLPANHSPAPVAAVRFIKSLRVVSDE
jgi:hypothetical protein